MEYCVHMIDRRNRGVKEIAEALLGFEKISGIDMAIMPMDYVKRMMPVRCKDCKHRPTPDEKGRGVAPGAEDCYGWGDMACPFICADGFYSRVPDDDFFCAYGEARDDLHPDNDDNL